MAKLKLETRFQKLAGINSAKYIFVLVYDKLMDKPDPLEGIILALDKAGVRNLGKPEHTRKVLITTIEFEHSAISEEKIQRWIEELAKKIEVFAYVRIYRYIKSAGKGRTDFIEGFQNEVRKVANKGLIEVNDHL
jgi:hypothetical protein